jgi:phosphoribosyl 1,2-cyclic phosphate phosphodiesterase
VRIVELRDGESFKLGDTAIAPFRLPEDYVYGFLLGDGTKRVLICPDETIGWRPSAEHKGVDLAVLPMGVSEFHPLTGQRQIPKGHHILDTECSYQETLEILDALDAKHAVLTHIEEPDGCSYDDLLQLEAELAGDGRRVSFAYDTMTVDA